MRARVAKFKTYNVRLDDEGQRHAVKVAGNTQRSQGLVVLAELESGVSGRRERGGNRDARHP